MLYLQYAVEIFKASMSNQPVGNSDNSNIWKPGDLKLFISHMAAHKKAVSLLANELKKYGISSFVANKDIKPTEEWRNNMLRALKSSDMFLAFITDDFYNDDWAGQEVGIACYRRIPIIPLKLETADLGGLIADTQAIIGTLDSPEENAEKIINFIKTQSKICA